MKTKHYIFILIMGLLISCSKDDDPQPEMGWFPAKITKTDYLTASDSRTINLEYNTLNQIGKIEITRTETGVKDVFNVSYNSVNQVETVQYSSTDPSSEGIRTYTFNYESGILVSWDTETVAHNGSIIGSGFRPVDYAHPTYTIEGREIDIDLYNNISRMKGYINTASGYLFVEKFIHRRAEAGVFADVEPKVPLQILFTVQLWMGIDLYAFSQYEISHLQLPLETIRNQDGQIASVLTTSGNIMYAKYEYEYERREK
ncbi:hypothetical protein [Alkaliflexus imshenetskii]|uniref:hypothetical protein n=1 Tax=Alkaliflexus imshenetskii TaxID=286730 RepID=UPI000479CAE0|nr:hypothetical protein [Alkaliflexus imshenetskii]